MGWNVESVVALEGPGFRRKASLIAGLQDWCSRRQLELVSLAPSEFGLLRDEASLSPTFVYAMISSGITEKQLLDIPKGTVFLRDVATPVKPGRDPSNHLRLGVRNAFGTNLGDWKVEQQFPLMPAPIPEDFHAPRSPGESDVIVLDVKPFHAPSTLLQVAALVAELLLQLEKLERRKSCYHRLYLTSFFNPEIFVDLLKNASVLRDSNSMRLLPDSFLERLIPPLEDHASFLRLLADARLFVTEHGDLADADVLYALQLGVPTLTYSRDPWGYTAGFQCSNLYAWELFIPDLKRILSQANARRIKQERGVAAALKPSPRSAVMDPSQYRLATDRCWDAIYDWAKTGAVSEQLTEAVKRGAGWNRGIKYPRLIEE
jgi:hypothetical protein